MRVAQADKPLKALDNRAGPSSPDLVAGEVVPVDLPPVAGSVGRGLVILAGQQSHVVDRGHARSGQLDGTCGETLEFCGTLSELDSWHDQIGSVAGLVGSEELALFFHPSVP